MVFHCIHCNRSYKYVKNLYNHLRSHESETNNCSICQKQFRRSGNLRMHYRTCLRIHTKSYKYGDGVLQNAIQMFTKNTEKISQNSRNIFDILYSSIITMESQIRDQLTIMKSSLKIFVSTYLIFNLAADPSHLTNPPVVMNSRPEVILSSRNIREKLEITYKTLVDLLEAFETNGSGFVLKQILKIHLYCIEYRPLRGGGGIS